MCDSNKMLGRALGSPAAGGFLGGLVGGGAVTMLTSKKGRKMAKSALKLGGIAAVGALVAVVDVRAACGLDVQVEVDVLGPGQRETRRADAQADAVPADRARAAVEGAVAGAPGRAGAGAGAPVAAQARLAFLVGAALATRADAARTVGPLEEFGRQQAARRERQSGG